MRHLILWIGGAVICLQSVAQAPKTTPKVAPAAKAGKAGPAAQTPKAAAQKLEAAVKALKADPQMKHAIIGFYIKDGDKVIWDENSQVGLAPASCQKVIVSTASLELLGEDFQYQTRIGYDGSMGAGVLNGNLYIVASGDPSLGSWRYMGSKPDDIMESIHGMLQAAGITRINGNILLDDHRFAYQPLPRGWVWEDLGNYYGAGAQGLNWHENQYDLDLQPGANPGDSTRILGARPELPTNDTLLNLITTGPKGSPDGSNIYFAPTAHTGYADGTIPAGPDKVTIGGSIPNPDRLFGAQLQQNMATWGITIQGAIKDNEDYIRTGQTFPAFTSVMGSLPSPSLDSLVYWFLKKSINLYGEALVKTLSLRKGQLANTDSGVAIVRAFWAQHGVEPTAFHIQDGSGLSPQNRVTACGLVQVLEFARTRPWFKAFYDALPLIDGISMKSGSIGGARGYTGYVGNYTFAFLVNNYDGSGTEIQHKMWKVLDQLK